MFMRMIYDDHLAAAAYLIGCQRTGEAIIIDPERDVDRYIELARREGLRITGVAETHIHADFLSGARELCEHTGATAYLSAEGGPDWQYQWLDKKTGGGSYTHVPLKHGQGFRVGNIGFKTLHTPGHTPEHVCFLVTDHGSGATEPMGILTGDFLFVGDLGRPDLLESAAGQAGMAESSAHRLYHSLSILRELPEFVQVWPAHGAGSACGKALGAVPMSTVGYERRFNPALLAAQTAQGEAGFVRFILEGQPEPPLYFARMKRDNRLGPRVLGGLPRPRAITPAELRAIDPRKAALIDTRPWDRFRAGHVPGSLFHPYNSAFVTDVGSMVREDEDIVLIIQGAMLDAALRDLVRIGLDRVVGWCEPSAVQAYQGEGGVLAVIEEIDPDEARRRLGSGAATSLDVRRATEFAEGRISGAANIAHTRLAARLEAVPKGKPVIVNCRSGGRSSRACALLQRAGYNVSNLGGGMLAWEKAGAPVER